MDISRQLELLDQQILDANSGAPGNFAEWHNRTDVVIRTIFGEDSPIHKKFQEVSYTPGFYTLGADLSPYRAAGVRNVVSILQSGKLELELLNEEVDFGSAAAKHVELSKQVFIVHGRDDARKFELAAFLQNLTGEQPTILHQQPNSGLALIEKFERSAGTVGFAVVLLTGDDLGRAKELDPADDRPRSRQNVVFEMGFFFGLIGRTRVAVLYEDGVELPSDINGLVYTRLDDAGGWKSKLAVELEGVGITVNWKAIGRS